MFAFAGGGSRIEIPRAPANNPKSGTVTSTPDDAELLKDGEAWASRSYLTRMIQMRVSSMYLKTIRSFCVT